MTAEENTKKVENTAKPAKAESAATEKSGPTRIPSALKRNRQSLEKRQNNKAYKSKVKTAIKDFADSLTEKNSQKAKEKLNLVFSLMDKGAKKKVFKLNKTSRIKTRLSQQLAKNAEDPKKPQKPSKKS